MNGSDFLNPDFLASQENLAVAVSGGPDSMALLHSISVICKEHALETRIHALTVNHNLRHDAQAEAIETGKWVQNFHNTEHHILTWQTPQKDARIMEAARAARYELMATYCEAEEISLLYIAHHRDDQAETFIFRLAKGSGLDGLGGIQEYFLYNEHLTLIRPLLNTAKDDLLTYCTQNKIPFHTDPSNQNETFARPRLRGSWDILEREGLSSKRIAKTATRLNRARIALEWLTDTAWHECVISTNKDLKVNLSLLSQYPDDIHVRVIQKSITLLSTKTSYAARMEKIESLSVKIMDTQTTFKKQTFSHVVFERTNQSGYSLLMLKQEHKIS